MSRTLAKAAVVGKLAKNWPLLIWLWPIYSCTHDSGLDCTGECAMSNGLFALVGMAVAVLVTAGFVLMKGKMK